MGVLHFKHKMWLEDWFSIVPNGSVEKKRLHFMNIYGNTWEILIRKKNNRRGSSTTWNCLAQSSNVDGKRRTWPLVTRIQNSETNVDLKLPNFERTRAVPSSKRKEAQNWGSIGLRWRDFSKLIEESNEDKIDVRSKGLFWTTNMKITRTWCV